jgi:CO/xanthine dehydrogenase Mo-binding subunit
MTAVGQSLPDFRAWDKVSGATPYAAHLELPGMVHAKVFRNRVVPHGRIRRLDTARAARLPGVLGILSGDDLAGRPNACFGAVLKDQPIVAVDRVRFVGDPVAVVAALTPEIAEDAVALIEAEYEELPAVMDARAAMREGAPRLHAALTRATTIFDPAHVPEARGANVCGHFRLRTGDVARAWARADHVSERVYTAPPTQHCAFEPHAVIARAADDRVEVWSATQNPAVVQTQLAELFALPLSRVRVVAPPLGSGYGSKLYPKLEPMVTALAMKIGRPVKLVLDREEVFLTLREQGTWIRIKTALSREGILLAREIEMVLDTGAYADITPRLVRGLGVVAAGPYRIPNLAVDTYAVYTNTPPAGALRGVMARQACWAYEQEMDRLAGELGIDPVELRLRNLLADGDAMHTGERLEAVATRECLERVRHALGAPPPAAAPGASRTVRAQGLACFIKYTMTPALSLADLRLEDDGSLAVHAASVEMGQGIATALAQIAADAIGLPLDRVALVLADTGSAPYDQGTNSSRSVFHMGRAIVDGCRELRRQLLHHAAALLEAAPDDLEVRDGHVAVKGHPATRLGFGEIVTRVTGRRGGSFQARGASRAESQLDRATGQGKASTYYFTGAAGCEVEVDRETGAVRVLRYVAAHNVGTAINPRSCRTQIEGAAVMGLSQTFFEALRWDEGQLLNGNLADYPLASICETPPVEVVLVEIPHPEGPFGAMGVGEPGIIPTSAAVGNAVARALGIRVFDLPLTPDTVLAAVQGR